MRENEFSRAQLWEPSFHNWHHPIASRGYTKAMADAAGVEGADMGMLRVVNDTWEIFMGSWITFDFSNQSHFFHANACNRYSVDPNGDLHPGWSYGPAHGFHDEVAGLFEDVYGRRPTLQEKMDIEHDQGLWNALRAASAAKNPPVVGEPPKPQEPSPNDRETLVAKLRNIQTAANEAKLAVARSRRPGGLPLATLDKLLGQIGRLTALLLLLCLLPLTGCSVLQDLIPGGVTPGDAKFTGVVSGPARPVIGALDPRLEIPAQILVALGQVDPLGLLLPVSLAGKTEPRWILCKDEFYERCRIAQVNYVVDFAGRPRDGLGLIWDPSRLSVGKP